MERPAKKYVVVVEEGLAPGLVVNTVLHLGTQFGAVAPQVTGTEVTDASGAVHSGLPVYPNVVLRAPADALCACIRAARDQAVEEGVLCLDYLREGHLTRTDDEYRHAVGQISTGSMVYYACLLFGDRKQVNKLIRGFSLWGS